jgi:hypothetical protein
MWLDDGFNHGMYQILGEELLSGTLFDPGFCRKNYLRVARSKTHNRIERIKICNFGKQSWLIICLLVFTPGLTERWSPLYAWGAEKARGFPRGHLRMSRGKYKGLILQGDTASPMTWRVRVEQLFNWFGFEGRLCLTFSGLLYAARRRKERANTCDERDLMLCANHLMLPLMFCGLV